ncbi:hypothetical protein R5H32_02305 [Defluviimonas sp. D31]|jgi:hypothetical protein|uniref:hypothetical protein n=1 Tax=Defluviimonas sp. D31 TaxID=3083253 RepID=UPI00296F93CC|nr:hypothetical protein [Defluviimonas sp. D31]MDW4548179.1 hypothetical protein [Defluviimonas sp. D31]
MTHPLPQLAFLAGGLAGLSACVGTAAEGPVYLGSEPAALGEDLYGFAVSMRGARDKADLEAYVDCVVAGYATEKNDGFARRVRTKVKEEGGVWSADAVYSITPTLPRGLMTIDAKAKVADCAERGIPTV